MLSNQLRLIIVVLLILLVLNLIRTFEEKLNEPKSVVLIEPQKNYTCEVEKVKNCHLRCWEINTATLLVLKPANCKDLKGLKKGQTITFEVLKNAYNPDGSINVVLLKGRGD